METVLGTAPEPSPRPVVRRPQSAAASLLRLQGMAGNAAVAALLQRAPTAGAPTPASIGEALAKVKVQTTKQTERSLQPWDIFRLVTANTPKKKNLYKELRAAWNALDAAKKRLAALPAPATTPPATLSRRHRGKGKGQAKHSAPADPAAQRAAATEAVEKAQERVDAAIAALKKFILADNDLLRGVRADERSLSKTLSRARQALTKLKKRKHPDAKEVQDSEKAVKTLEQQVAEIPKRRQEAVDKTNAALAKTSFSPELVEKTVYTFEIEGESVTLSDHVEAWATKFEQGLDEHKSKVQAKLDDVLAQTKLSESIKKILRAISDNESGSAPWSSVNTYDRAVLTWGLVQWTGGSHSDLTSALTTMKATAPAAFAERFEKYGIDVVNDQLVITGADGSTRVGDDAAMGIMGSPTLSAVMSRAGLDSRIQQAELAAAAEQQITGPLGATFEVDAPPPAAAPKDAKPGKKAGKVRLRYGQVLTSELAAGLFADRVVNAGKGGTQAKVAAAVRAYVKRKGVDPHDVATWAADVEKTLIPLLSPYANRVTPFVTRGCSKVPGSYSA